MKIQKCLIVVLGLTLFFVGSNAMAAEKIGAAGATMTLTDSANPDLTLAASPSVALYYGNGTANDTQWYLVSSFHEGGTKVFATAQNSTSVWKTDRDTGDDFGDVKDLFPATADDALSDTNWSGDWDR